MNEDFQKELNKLEETIIKSWYDQTGHKIGLTIQIDEEIQDKDSPTRDTKACDVHGLQKNLINAYCTKILEAEGGKNIPMCNGLDFHLKDLLRENKKENKRIENIGCRCHQGISNFVIPYRYMDLEPTFYIFIGQFLLKPVKEQFEKIFKRVENVNTLKNIEIDLPLKKYVKPNPFVSEQVYKSKLIDTGNGNDNSELSPIAYIDFSEYIAYEKFVVYHFSQWIKKYYTQKIIPNKLGRLINRNKEVSKKLKPTEPLRSFMAHENLKSISYFLENAKSVDAPKFNDINRKIIMEIEKLIKEQGKALSNHEKKELKLFSKMHKNAGIVNSQKYYKEGQKVIKMLKNNEKN